MILAWASPFKQIHLKSSLNRETYHMFYPTSDGFNYSCAHKGGVQF